MSVVNCSSRTRLSTFCGYCSDLLWPCFGSKLSGFLHLNLLAPSSLVLVLLHLLLGASDSKLATSSQCGSPRFFWALPDPSRGRPSPSICGGKAYSSCICYLSKRHFVRDFLPRLQVEVVKRKLSFEASFKNCKLNLIASCSHGSSVIVLCLFFAVTVFCHHSLFLALLVLCIQHP